jgi:aerobic carbon-monoxide dehydrogenase small subunit
MVAARKGKKAAVAKRIAFSVNGEAVELEIGSGAHQVQTSHTLAHTLRENLGLVGTKITCDNGACGSCTVLMDGRATLSCMTLTVECEGRSIVTIEGLADRETGKLDPLQQSFIDHTAFQCGFCTPGMIMSAKSLLADNPKPDEEEVKEALSGNFCRCISHYQVVRAVLAVAQGGD